mgnify:FL=1
MSTLSVPLTQQLEETINGFVRSGYAANKADVVRKALKLLAQEEAVMAVLEAERELDAGKGLRGDLDVLAKRLRKHG